MPRTAIPLAPIWTARAHLTARLPLGLSSDLGMIYVGDCSLDPLRQQTVRRYTRFTWTGRYSYEALEASLSMEICRTHRAWPVECPQSSAHREELRVVSAR